MPHKTCPQCGKSTPTKDATYCSPECREIGVREKALRRYADPAYRARWEDGIAQRSASQEWRTRQRQGSLERNERSQYRQALTDGIDRRRSDPQWRASMEDNPLWKRGPENPNWKGTQTERQLAYGRAEYTQWRDAVFARDDYTCQHCQARGGSLHAHHIKGWSETPKLRYEVENGATLCVECHSTLHGHYIPGRFPKDRKLRN